MLSFILVKVYEWSIPCCYGIFLFKNEIYHMVYSILFFLFPFYRYLAEQDIFLICFGYLTYHFFFAIVCMKGINSPVLGEQHLFTFKSCILSNMKPTCQILAVTVRRISVIWFMHCLLYREQLAFLDKFRGTFRWHICFNFGMSCSLLNLDLYLLVFGI